MTIETKKQLAMILSKLRGFHKPSERLEQYATDSEIAAETIWFAYYLGEIKDKSIVDLGAGTGVLGCACLALGAKKVTFVDIDEEALRVARENVSFLGQELGQPWDNVTFVIKRVQDYIEKADIVVENPPFGIQGTEHADREFLASAFKIAPVVYSFHKLESEGFVKAFSDDNMFKITHFWQFDFPIKKTMDFHKKRIYRVKVGCWRLEKEKTPAAQDL